MKYSSLILILALFSFELLAVDIPVEQQFVKITVHAENLKTDGHFAIVVSITSEININQANLNFILPKNVEMLKGDLVNSITLTKQIPLNVILEVKTLNKSDFKFKSFFFTNVNESKTNLIQYAFFEIKEVCYHNVTEQELKDRNNLLKSTKINSIQFITFNQLDAVNNIDILSSNSITNGFN